MFTHKQWQVGRPTGQRPLKRDTVRKEQMSEHKGLDTTHKICFLCYAHKKASDAEEPLNQMDKWLNQHMPPQNLHNEDMNE